MLCLGNALVAVAGPDQVPELQVQDSAAVFEGWVRGRVSRLIKYSDDCHIDLVAGVCRLVRDLSQDIAGAFGTDSNVDKAISKIGHIVSEVRSAQLILKTALILTLILGN